MADKEVLDEMIEVVESTLMKHGFAIQNMVIIIDATNPDFESEVLVATSVGLKAWQSLGLLEIAKSFELKGLLSDG